jgi:hypothetical protein
MSTRSVERCGYNFSYDNMNTEQKLYLGVMVTLSDSAQEPILYQVQLMYASLVM